MLTRPENLAGPEGDAPCGAFVNDLAAKYDASSGPQGPATPGQAPDGGGEGGDTGGSYRLPPDVIAPLENGITALVHQLDELKGYIGEAVLERKECPENVRARLLKRLETNPHLKQTFGHEAAQMLAKIALVRDNPGLSALILLAVVEMAQTGVVFKQIFGLPDRKEVKA